MLKNTLKQKKTVFIIFLILLFLTATIGSYIYFNLSRIFVNNTDPETTEPETAFNLTPIPTAPFPQTSYYNILLLGYGGGGHSGGNLSDTIILVHIDPEKKTATLISVPRDLWIALPAEGNIKINRKINSAYAIGGYQLAKQAVSEVVGMPVHYFVSVSFDSFKQAIDILDGINVNVPVTFDDYWYPVKGRENDPCGKTEAEIDAIVATMSGFAGEKQFPCRYEHIHFEKGIQHLSGDQALKFVRSRHSSQHGGDFARSQRQQALLFGIKDTLFSLGVLEDAILFFNQVSHTIKTDLDENAIKIIIKAVNNQSDYSFPTIQLTEQNALKSARGSQGQSILIPKAGEGNWQSIHQYIKKELN